LTLPFVHSLQNLALEVYPTSGQLIYTDQDVAHVLVGLQYFEKGKSNITNSDRAQYLAMALAKGTEVDTSFAVENAAWMIVNYKPLNSWDERDVRLFFSMTLVHTLGYIQKVFYEGTEEQKVYRALFPTDTPPYPVDEIYTQMKDNYSSLLERVLERASNPSADLRHNK